MSVQCFKLAASMSDKSSEVFILQAYLRKYSINSLLQFAVSLTKYTVIQVMFFLISIKEEIRRTTENNKFILVQIALALILWDYILCKLV
jgi:hypothetical protein